MKNIVISCLFVISCNISNKRNIISFKVPFEQVADSIKVVNNIFLHKSLINYYIYDDNTLLFGTKEIGVLDSMLINKAKQDTSIYSQMDIRLFNIILFLKKNGINSCFEHRDFGSIVYCYKSTEENIFDDTRYILLKNDIDSNSFNFFKSQKIIDQKGELFLVAPKKAKIK